MPEPTLTVILCTLNPPAARLAEVVGALAGQTLARERWELLVVDNGSREPVAERLAWPAGVAGRVLVERTPGQAAARRAGIAAARADWIVFVDDDNVLAPDYLAEVRRIAAEKPWLAALGGSITGRWERQPEAWQEPYLKYLAVRTVKEELWTNQRDAARAPYGAGLAVTAEAARRWAVNAGAGGALLGRRGDSLASGDDTDLVFTAVTGERGMGLFPSLRLEHLIGAGRLEVDYLERLLRGIAASAEVVRWRHGLGPTPPPRGGWLVRQAWRWTMRKADPRVRRMERALETGREEGLRLVEELVRGRAG